MKIVLDINPPKSTGQSGKRLGRLADGRAMMFETKESREVKKMFYSLLYEQKPKEPFNRPLEVNYTFFYPYNSTVRRSIVKRGEIVPKVSKPDWDNLPKQIQDVMSKLGYWTDDALIFSGRCEKFYAPRGRISIEIIPYPEDCGFKRMFAECGKWED